MNICALKITHDGTVAYAEDSELIFSVELEKINSNPRFSHINKIEDIDYIFNMFNRCKEDVDVWLIDGWAKENLFLDYTYVDIGTNRFLVNNYENKNENIDKCEKYRSEILGEYYSFTHVYSHLCATYCTSPFAKSGESSYILMFDGGSKSALYYYDVRSNNIRFIDYITKFGGDIYPGLASKFEEFAYTRRKKGEQDTFTHHYAGTVMAYIALGNRDEEIIDYMREIYDEMGENSTIENGWKENRLFEDKIVNKFGSKKKTEDILNSLQCFLEEKIIDGLCATLNAEDNDSCNLCFAGGSMLNIKWNTKIKDAFPDYKIFAPPFINDTGAAIGQICAYRLQNRLKVLNWNTYLGPVVQENYILNGWKRYECELSKLASIISETREPVVVINNRSELGPRALGNRSIIADARGEKIKAVLNDIKQREYYRPVAPVCLEEDAPLYFIPGDKDEYMLFEHDGTEFAKQIVPSIFHIDGSARVQTVSMSQNETLYRLLCEYKKLTGISVLCNTSANFKGKGFFPDVASAQKWGGCKYVWSNNILYEKENIE